MGITARTTIFGNIIQFDKADGESLSHYRVFRRSDATTPSETDYIGDVPISDKPSYIDLFSDLTNRSIYRYYIKTVTRGGQSSVFSRTITASTTEVIKIGSTATLSVEIEAVNVTIRSTSTAAQTQSKTWQNTEDFDGGTLVGLSSDDNRLTLDNATAAGSWAVGGNLNTGRRYPAGAGASMLAGLCIGGYVDTGIASLTVEEYDGINWVGGGNLNTEVYAGAAAGTQIAALSFGGLSAGTSTEEYDGTAWTEGGTFNSAKRYLGGFGVSNNALAVGGYNGTAQTSVEKYNGSTWNTISGLNAGKYALGACGTVGAGLAFAGLPLTSTTTSEEFDGVNWSVGGALSSGRQYPAGFGTQNLGICAGGYSNAATVSTEEYNGSGWTAGGALNTARHAMAGCGTKASGLCFGGLPTASMTVTEEYSSAPIASGTWTIDLDTTADSSFGNIDLSETGAGTIKARIKTATAQGTLGAASWVPATGYYTVFPAAVTAADNRWYRLEVAFSGSASIEDVTQDFTPTQTGGITLDGPVNALDNPLIDVGYIDFNLVNGISASEGRLSWNDDDGTLNLGLPGGTVVLQIGQEHIARVFNPTTATITDGSAVYVSGSTGSRIEVTPAIATGVPQGLAIGLTTEDIGPSQFGYITTNGLVRGLNTSGMAAGALVILDDVTPGAWSASSPTSHPSIKTPLGHVARVHSAEGSILVDPRWIPPMMALSDVSFDTATDTGQFLRWHSATETFSLVNLNLWETAAGTITSSSNMSFDGKVLNIGTADSTTTIEGQLNAPYQKETNEPTGFENRTDSIISFNDGTRTFSISPAATSYSYWQKGEKFTKTAATTIQPTNTTGITWVYFESGTLTSTSNIIESQIDVLFKQKVIVAAIYWNTATSTSIYFGEERHGIQMDGQTHEHLHHSFGTIIRSGLGLNTITADASGATDDHAQFGTATGEIADEDIEISITANTSTTGLTLYYKNGADSAWVTTTNAGFSIATIDSGRMTYNQNDSGTWTLTEVTNNRFALCHVFASTELNNPMLAIIGENQYTTLNNARSGATTEINTLSMGDLPGLEMRAIGTVIFQTSNAYGNAVKSRIRSTGTGDDWIDFRTTLPSGRGVLLSDHGGLSGLGDDDHSQYLNIGGRTAGQSVCGDVTFSNSIHTSQSLTVVDNIMVSTAGTTATNAWRFIINGNNLEAQRYDSGVWTHKGGFTL